MNPQYPIFRGTHLRLEAVLAFGLLLGVMLLSGPARAGIDADTVPDDLVTAAERADEPGRDAELDLYSKVLRATQGRGAYRLLIKTAQHCDSTDKPSG